MRRYAQPKETQRELLHEDAKNPPHEASIEECPRCEVWFGPHPNKTLRSESKHQVIRHGPHKSESVTNLPGN